MYLQTNVFRENMCLKNRQAGMITSIQKCMRKLEDDFGDTVSISILNASRVTKYLSGSWNLERWTNRPHSFWSF
jgi:hypothetical protein